jgi:AraC-like DNA-binding protein
MAKRRQPAARDPSRAIPAPAAYLRAMLRRFAPTPELRAKILAGTDVDEKRLADPAAEVTLFTFLTLSENLTRIVGPTWPLEAVPAWSSAMQGALEVAVRSAATVDDAIDVLVRYGHVRGPFLDLAAKRDKKHTKVVLGTRIAINEGTRRAMIETAALSAYSMLREVLDDATAQVSFQFPWDPPPHAARFAAVVSAKVSYRAPQCAVIVPTALCAQASPFADPALHASAIEELEATARRITGDDMLALRLARLFKRRRHGRFGEEEAAKDLGMSRRTLVRKLAAAGTSYRTLLDADLRRRAEIMLERKSLTRAEMAEVLGFQDPTSFSRACRRWFKT